MKVKISIFVKFIKKIYLLKPEGVSKKKSEQDAARALIKYCVISE